MKKATGSETEKLPTGLWVDGCRWLAWPGAPPVMWRVDLGGKIFECFLESGGVPAGRLLLDIDLLEMGLVIGAGEYR